MDLEYIYANGRVRALETTFLPERIWRALLAAQDQDEALRVLSETYYGEFLQRSQSPEEAFERVLAATEEELLELAEHPDLVTGLLQRRDVRNARYLWKAALFGGGQIPVERAGTLEPEVLQRVVSDLGARDELPPAFSLALETIVGGQLEVRQVDQVLDALAARVEEEVLAPLNRDLATWVRMRVEVRNFLTAGRARQAGMQRADVEAAFLDGGHHSPAELALAYQLNDLPATLAAVPGGERLSGVFAEALAGGSFLPFERESDALALDLLEDLGAETFGPGPLAAFVLLREMETAHVKLLLAGKAAGIPRARLQQRLPRGGRSAAGGV